MVFGGKRVNKDLHTDDIQKLLRENGKFDQVLHISGDAINNPTLHSALSAMQQSSGLTIAQIADAALLSHPYAYQVFSGKRNPGRDILICITLVMGLDLTRTQKLLLLANKGELYPRVCRDAAIIFGIHHRYTLTQMEDFLIGIGEASLLSRMP
jgi:transcriptional regulator with XRE-family HTH domain